MGRRALLTVALATALATMPLAGRATAADQTSSAAARPVIADLGTGMTVTDVSSRGDVVGDLYDRPAKVFFRWRSGHLSTYGQLGAVTARHAAAVNRTGAMALWTAFDTSVRFQNGATRDLGSLVRPRNETLAIDMNDAGTIVGASVGPDFNWHAFSWSAGTITDLGGLGGDYTAASAVNDSGQTVGVSHASNGTNHVVLWDGGDITDIGALADNGSVSDVNDAGQIVGTTTSAAGRIRAFVITGGVMTKLPPLPGGDTSLGAAINDRGDVVGQSTTANGESHAVLWRGGAVRDLGTLGGSTSNAIGISEGGLVAGNALDTRGVDHAVTWTV